MSLLDAGLHGDHAGVFIDSEAMFNEDMFGYSALRARIGARARPSKLNECIISFFKYYMIHAFIMPLFKHIKAQLNNADILFATL